MPSTDKLRVTFLGTRVPYREAMARMRQAMAVVDLEGPELLLLEHKDTITKTRQHGTKSFRVSEDEIIARGIDVIETDRGGDVTFHGEGQLVGYLVKRLPDNDLVGYVRALETALIKAMQALSLSNAMRLKGKTGVWLPHQHNPRKLIAIGVGVSQGVTRHGFALNVTTKLERFTECIVPCGLNGFEPTSLEREMAQVPDFETIREAIVATLNESSVV